MTFPIPKFKECIVPSLDDREQAIRAYRAVEAYLIENTYVFQTSSQSLGSSGYHDKSSALTKEGIVISSSARTLFGPSGFHSSGRVPEHWMLEVFSFEKPVDEVKNELEKIIEEAKTGKGLKKSRRK